jgi:DNA-binding beta-propeller fold protein YncE
LVSCGGSKGDSNSTGESASETAGSSDDSSNESSDSNASGESESDSGQTKFDTPDGETGGECDCGSQLEFSYIWVANSQESTISKINTETMVEEGRYLTREDLIGNPSRTSVSLSGKAVAVANRNGGVMKVWTLHEDCDEMQNGQPGLQTSGGKNEVLAWGEDDCVHWYTPFEDYTSQRPIAWIPDDCDYTDENLWTSGCTYEQDENIFAHRLDGDTGQITDTAEVLGYECSFVAGYGGAVDLEGNFWISTGTRLARVDAANLNTQVWTTPVSAYGITVDHAGRPWISTFQGHGDTGAARFDPETETFDLATGAIPKSIGGLAEDADGRMWMGFEEIENVNGEGVVPIDVDSMVVGTPIVIPGLSTPKGVGIDLAGKVWAIALGGPAFRVDPDTEAIDSYGGLNSPYTYSDMTGWALQNAACTPEG